MSMRFGIGLGLSSRGAAGSAPAPGNAVTHNTVAVTHDAVAVTHEAS